ncbi:MAG: membrane integrity-associated transporter subunit PqiC [Rhodopila sp.]
MVSVGLAAGCTSPNPRLYTLAPVPGTPEGGGPHVVLMHQVTVARYLERPEIVRSSDNYRLDVMANDTWSEPVGAMIGRVLAEDLAQRLPGTTFVNSASAVAAKEDASVRVNIQRMDMNANQQLVLVAQASVEFTEPQPRPAMRSLNTVVPLSATAPSYEVQGMSIAVGQLADEIAEMLRQPTRPAAPARHRR